MARFVNHSCNPNCQTQKWIVGDVQRMGIFAHKRIKAGTELTFDYKFVRYGAEAQPCFCGEPNCKGTIGDSVNPAQKQGQQQAKDSERIETVLKPVKLLQVDSVVQSLMEEIGNPELVLHSIKRLMVRPFDKDFRTVRVEVPLFAAFRDEASHFAFLLSRVLEHRGQNNGIKRFI